MADQFCRIVDTTVTNNTLGSDAAQTILTTDANTSYVIRDIYKTDSDTSDTFCMKFDIEMDGQKVHTDLATSASGSLIVPPSTTVCIKDTTGNYPLEYLDFCGSVLAWCCATSSGWNSCSNGYNCFGTFCLTTYCTVAGTSEGSCNTCCVVDSCIANCCCYNLNPTNLCYGTFGTARISSNGEYYLTITNMHEQPYKGVRVQTTADGCCAMQHFGENACESWLFEDDLLVYICGNNCFKAWDLSQSGETCFCFCQPDMACCRASCFCATYCCGNAYLSTAQKGCFACRALTTVCTNGQNCNFVTIINLCTGYFCKLHSYCEANVDVYRRMNSAFWSEAADAWVAVSAVNQGMTCDAKYDYVGVCVLSGTEGGTSRTLSTTSLFSDSPEVNSGCFCMMGACLFGSKLYFRDTCDIPITSGELHELYYMDLDDFANTGTLPTVRKVGSCFFCGIVPTCGKPLASYCVKETTPSAGTISGRSYATNPTSKLTVYGIKSS